MIIIKCSKIIPKEMDINWTLESFKRYDIFKSVLKYTLPIMNHTYADFITFFFAGFYVFELGSDYVYAYNAISNTNSVFFCTIIGFGVTTVSYVCNEFGKNEVKKAKTYSVAGFFLVFIFTIIFSGALFVGKKYWIAFFTSDESVIEIINDAFYYWIFITLPFDGAQEILECYMKGIEFRNFVSRTALVCFYGIALPL